ncbi:M23 family metallopeptidase [Glycomyces terrestris]|uniref:M23 family metallopeptidase n=1 Tax=Glycomyces terrestris TaxID=2493553 RepID=A0A426UY24_9ACTN|nr:M23 family metallopeptidase [Glycomyces terrestris]RRR99470.1 M23 family metallopeptidase [Glycomyces terrestris]
MSIVSSEAASKERADDPAAPRVPKRLRPLVWTLAVLSVCCLGAVVSIVQLLSDQSDEEDGNVVLAGCGTNVVIDPDSEFPEIGPYSSEQIGNAAVIIAVGQDLEVPVRGWVIAVATAMQESRLTNLGHLGEDNDHDSLGLFQQRPSSGWGTPDQVTDPVYASTKFYEKLVKIDDWETLPLTVAAQRVQISAFPDAYAKHEPLATEIVNTLTGGGANVSAVSTQLGTCAQPGELSAAGWMSPVAGPVWSGFQTPERPTHNGVDIGAPRGATVVAASSGTVITSECNASLHGQPYSCDVDGSPEVAGCGWYVNILHAGDYLTRYCHFGSAPLVKEGDVVQAGQILGYVGSSGRSSGPHLHYETHLNADRSPAGAVDPVAFMQQMGAPLG